jgi:hypothetical protein
MAQDPERRDQSDQLLALVLEQQEGTVFQRLREWSLDARTTLEAPAMTWT